MDGEGPPGGGRGGAPFEPTALKSSGTSGAVRTQVRFTPGTMLGDRYRVVALLGKGGMGEVYRAEDTRLGQQVALKFLPAEIASDPQKLQRLYDEVRVGRQVSHPNVCRLYDLAEIEGHRFIAMEYIDGEDLASLLRRIGKLPHEKALDLARDICAGLAAAHGLGIVHRDLKPANVMIDGRGDARITDFGLAVLAEELEERREVAGTPAYMAPEQLAGGEVTQKTDLYALGLLLYEIFTGKRLFAGDTFGEIVSQHSTTSSQGISRETSTLDPAVQRVIVRCLEQDAAKRPASIHSVIAALPGGDPLQAAIDAGETPSPEMVAAAGSSGELPPAVAWPLLVITLLLLLACVAISPRVRLYGKTPLPFDGNELAVRARQFLEAAGLTRRPVDRTWEFTVDSQYRLWKRDQSRAPSADRIDASGTFGPLLFAYKESPEAMVTPWRGRVTAVGVAHPPLTTSGLARVLLEPDGRLRRLFIVAPEIVPPTAPERAPDWETLFRAARLDFAAARPTAPLWRPPVASDSRFAWTIAIAGGSNPVRIEGASLAGRVVFFEAFAPWRKAAAPPATTRRPVDRLLNLISTVLLLSALVFGVWLAGRNLRRGRGDRQGASRLAWVAGGCGFMGSILVADHFADPALELSVIMTNMAFAVFTAVLTWTWYVALEPYLRRTWPRTLISWSRLLQKRWLDARVGRDLLIGILAGSALRLANWLALDAPSWLGWETPMPSDVNYMELSGWKFNLGFLFQDTVFALTRGLGVVVMLLVAHLVFRRRGIAIAVLFVAFLTVYPVENYPVLEWITRPLIAATLTFVMVRYGVLSLIVAMTTAVMFGNIPATLDPAAWYFARAIPALALLFGLAIFGFVRSLGSHAIFAAPVLED